jgi:hypothetical protein
MTINCTRCDTKGNAPSFKCGNCQRKLCLKCNRDAYMSECCHCGDKFLYHQSYVAAKRAYNDKKWDDWVNESLGGDTM